jgi:tRNA pseudouridine55 synthase
MKQPKGPSGFIIADKPAGITSFDVIRELRRITGIRKLGHSGVLDKPATGVLVVGANNATRLFELFNNFEKEYTADIWLGLTTNTDDLSGELAATGDCSGISREQFAAALAEYHGTIDQIPPAFSLTKKGGKELYRYALAGEEVEATPKRVTILESILDEFETGLDASAAIPPGSKLEGRQAELPRLARARVRLRCVGGVYVRCIARDVGADLGCFGALGSLVRTRVGPFLLDDAWTLDGIFRALEGEGSLDQVMLPLAAVSPDESRMQLDPQQLGMVRNGQSIQRFKQHLPPSAAKRGDIVYGMDSGHDLAVILTVQGVNQHGLVELKPTKVLN